MDSKNFAIGILSATGVLLFVGLLIVNSRPAPALASGMTAKGGDYVLTVGRDASGDEEFLYIISAPLERLIAYRFDGGKRQIQIVQGIELGLLRRADDQAGQPKGSRSRSRGRRP